MPIKDYMFSLKTLRLQLQTHRFSGNTNSIRENLVLSDVCTNKKDIDWQVFKIAGQVVGS